jgi:DNA-binding LacI/PurR family transcriptional regulator
MELSGRAAVELLLNRLADGGAGPAGPHQRVLGTQLIVRSSTAPPMGTPLVPARGGQPALNQKGA